MTEEIRETLLNNTNEESQEATQEPVQEKPSEAEVNVAEAKDETTVAESEAKDETTVAEPEAQEVVENKEDTQEKKEKKFNFNKHVYKEKALKARKAYKNNKLRKHILKNNKRIINECIAIALIMVAFAVLGSKYIALYPYSFTINDKTICYVDGDKQADEVVEKLLEDYKVEGTEVRAVDTEGMFKVEKSNEIKVASDEVKEVDEAVELIQEAALQASTEGNDFNVTVACTKTETIPYTPTPNYEKDDTMVAGQSEVVVKGEDGTQKQSTTYTTVNGEVQGEAVTATEILDEGSPATIKKGTLGLPEGEDWRTYEGDPTYKNGEEVVKLAASYSGLRYILGGSNLNKGVSCIGLVVGIYKKFGINLPMSVSRMRKVGVGVSYNNMQPGDIICYTGHFAIYAGNGKIVDSRSGGGVGVRSTGSVGQKVIGVRRIVEGKSN